MGNGTGNREINQNQIQAIQQTHNPIYKQIIEVKFQNKITLYNENIQRNPPIEGIGIKEGSDYFYLGNFKDSKFDDSDRGILIMIIETPRQIEIYEGQFEGGNAQGYGKLFIDGNQDYLYEGYFKNNQQNAEKGCEQQKDFIYTGGFVNGVKQGYGKFEKKEENRTLKFKGYMEKNQMGHGKLKIKTNETIFIYKGKFVDGQMNDSNAIVKQNNQKYIGGYRQGTFHGNGSYITQHQEIQGQFENGALVSN